MLVLIIIGVSSVDALTKSDLDKIEHDYFDFWSWTIMTDENNNTIHLNFKENELPNIVSVENYIFFNLIWEMEDDKYKYILNQDFEEKGEKIQSQIPADVFESQIEKRFDITQEFYDDLHKNYNIYGSNDSAYKQIDDKYYYYASILYNMGFAINENMYIMGYEDLGSDYYQVYFYVNSLEEEKLIGEEKVYFERDMFDYEQDKYVTSKIVVTGYLTSKMQYKDGVVKFLSLEECELPIDEDLILYEDAKEVPENKDEDKTPEIKDGANQTFNINSDANLTFTIDADYEMFDKVYVDGKEIDNKNYTSKSGSTIIIFKDEYTKELKDGEHTLKVTFKDSTEVETKFIIKQTVVNPDTGINLGFSILFAIIAIGSYIYIY